MTRKANQTTTTTPAAEPTTNDQSGIPTIDLSSMTFAQPKTVKGKSIRPFCQHEGCKLRVTDTDPDHRFCVNHVPAEQKLTEQEAIALAGWLTTLTPAELLRAYVRAYGWYKAKEQAKELQTTKQ